MENNFFNIYNKKLIILIFSVLIILTFATSYYGSGDIADYSNPAKFFAGKFPAKIRTSHSYMLGFIHTPFVWLTNSFIMFKVTSLIFLSLIIYSVYIINKKDKRSFWLMLLSPVVWYMAPSINPIQLSALFLLWAYYFIEKYDKTKNLPSLFYSGILIGLGWAVWDTIIFFGAILGILFLYNRKFSHFIYFVFFIFLGLTPRLILDYFLFDFAFFTTLKTFLSGFVNLTGGIYGKASGHTPKTFANLFSVFLTIPLYFWILYKPKYLKENKKTIAFLSLSILLILFNPQIRYTLALIPIIIVLLGGHLSEKQFKRQIFFSLFVLFLFIIPHIIQIPYNIDNKVSTEGIGFTYLLSNSFNVNLNKQSANDLVKQDLEEILTEYPNETFVVGNKPDDYQILAHLSWNQNVQEFVSIQDYELEMRNETVLYEKKFMPVPNIKNRRQIWIAGGLNKNENDDTDYDSITLGLGIDEPIKPEGFSIVKKYNRLYLSKKIG